MLQNGSWGTNCPNYHAQKEKIFPKKTLIFCTLMNLMQGNEIYL